MGSYLVLADWISIHAPARGATDRRRTGRYQGYFNPRSREGSDAAVAACASDYFEFQSTLPRGERPPGNTVSARAVYFNPRSREGSDQARTRRRQRHSAFQSTLPRGERRGRRSNKLFKRLFQSTLPRGERR